MAFNTVSSQKVSFDDVLAPDWQPKKTSEYPRTTASVVRQMQKDFKKDYQFFIKDKNVKEIKITKIDKKNGTIHLWIHKKDRTYIPRILSILIRYPFRYMTFSPGEAQEYLLKCTVEINPTNIPKGIVILN